MNLFDLTGKVAIGTGGNGGIGLGIALGLAQAGAKIVVLGRNAEKSRTAVKWLHAQTGSEALAVTGDVIMNSRVSVCREPDVLAAGDLLRGADVTHAHLEIPLHDFTQAGVFGAAEGALSWMRGPTDTDWFYQYDPCLAPLTRPN